MRDKGKLRVRHRRRSPSETEPILQMLGYESITEKKPSSLLTLSLKRRISWLELARLKCVHGIPHGCRPGSAVRGYRDTDRWPLPVPTTKAIDPGSTKKREVPLDGPRLGLQLLFPTFPSGRWWGWRDDLSNQLTVAPP